MTLTPDELRQRQVAAQRSAAARRVTKAGPSITPEQSRVVRGRLRAAGRKDGRLISKSAQDLLQTVTDLKAMGLQVRRDGNHLLVTDEKGREYELHIQP